MVIYAPQSYCYGTMRQNFLRTNDYPKRNITKNFVTLPRKSFN